MDRVGGSTLVVGSNYTIAVTLTFVTRVMRTWVLSSEFEGNVKDQQEAFLPALGS